MVTAQTTIAVITAAVILFVGIWTVSLVISSINLPYTTVTTTNETIASSGSVPETITATNVYDGILSGTEEIYVNDTDTNTVVKLVRDQNYTVLSYTDGTFNITNAAGVNSTSDYYLVSYDAKDIDDTTQNTFNTTQTIMWNSLSLLAVGLVVLAASVILGYFGFGRRK